MAADTLFRFATTETSIISLDDLLRAVKSNKHTNYFLQCRTTHTTLVYLPYFSITGYTEPPSLSLWVAGAEVVIGQMPFHMPNQKCQHLSQKTTKKKYAVHIATLGV